MNDISQEMLVTQLWSPCWRSQLSHLKGHSTTPKKVTKNCQAGDFRLASGWFQPMWKTLVKFGSFPQVGVKIKIVWNHHLISDLLVPWLENAKSCSLTDDFVLIYPWFDKTHFCNEAFLLSPVVAAEQVNHPTEMEDFFSRALAASQDVKQIKLVGGWATQLWRNITPPQVKHSL